jgi:hypothetical protein
LLVVDPDLQDLQEDQEWEVLVDMEEVQEDMEDHEWEDQEDMEGQEWEVQEDMVEDIKRKNTDISYRNNLQKINLQNIK